MDPINFQDISLSTYNYNLPSDKIAIHPLQDRDNCLLLDARTDKFSKTNFGKLLDIIPTDTFFIFNDSRVIPARIFFYKKTGAKIEIFLLNPTSGLSFHEEMAKIDISEWHVLVGNASKWKNEPLETSIIIDDEEIILKAEKKEGDIVKFSWNKNNFTFSEILDTVGNIPLPPYIKRKARQEDKSMYQTVFAKNEGSVAAPTAGLHFSIEMLAHLRTKKFNSANVTLNVGIGTFRPVKTDIQSHEMHEESFSISHEDLTKLVENVDKKWLLIGTTTLRTLESLYIFANKNRNSNNCKTDNIVISQWDHLAKDESTMISRKDAFNFLLKMSAKNGKSGLHGKTSLFIIKGKPVVSADLLITNFHQPCSTLLMLVDAFASVDWKEAYNFAMDENFRFLSYGDACLFENKNKLL